MKKGLFALGIAVVSVFALTSCELKFNTIPGGDIIDNVLPDHVHKYSEEVIAPTCTEKGYTKYTCTVDGCKDPTYNGNWVNALGHTKGEVEIIAGVAPSCTEDGYHNEKFTCTVCNEVVENNKVVDEKLGHDFKYNLGYVAPTCTTPGSSNGGQCTRCGEAAVVGDVPALGHTYEYNSLKDLSNGHKAQVYKCATCTHTADAGVQVDITKTYEYQQFKTNNLYTDHGNAYAEMYEAFYEGCMNVLKSNEDYVLKNYGSDYDYCVIAEYNYKGTGMTASEAGNILFSFVSANPQFYFLESRMFTLSSTLYEKICLVLNEDYLKAADRKAAEKQIVTMSADFTDSIKGLPLTEDQLAKKIHDYICNEINYQYDDAAGTIPSVATWAHNMMGFMDGDDSTGGVCECYAKSYQYLSYLCGLNSIIVSGTSRDNDGNVGGHAWNYTKVGTKWYAMDVTWDDQSSIIYDYFLCSLTKISNQHTPGDSNPASNAKFFQVKLPTLETNNYLD